MTLFAKCINIIARPEVIKIYISQLPNIPVNVKIALLNILCKRGLIQVAILKCLVNSKITEMDLSECDVNDHFLSCLNVCTNLKKLDLSLRRRQVRCISKKALISLFSNLPYLNILAIPHCKELDDEVMKVICETCTQLKELHIPNSSVTDLSLLYVGQYLSHLSALNILGTQISDMGIEHLTNGPLSKNLSEISLDKCPNVSSHSSMIIAERCPNIKIFTCGSFFHDDEIVLAINGIRSKAKQVFWSVI